MVDKDIGRASRSPEHTSSGEGKRFATLVVYYAVKRLYRYLRSKLLR